MLRIPTAIRVLCVVRVAALAAPCPATGVEPSVLVLLGVPVPEWMEGRPLVSAPVAGTVSAR